ncbi:type II secretion system minor pseudopilin GspI [Luteimonas sp. JM171]|uniref:type II secretion system minor pseudopilin GspI n=1 Tax=Luteimonas sp. JM171 TaxID=1896164 RepID=UPI000856ACA4|nr:type II secretion system minor pseudopilin GspI [Luteimonas sp. JM171]AOH36405.1 type II secretion system protein GspI [Luteimonas sp. JM171]
MTRIHRPGRRAGFSLLELLVALAVFSLVVLALLNLAGESTRTAVIVEERVLAGIVAGNRAVEAAVEPLDMVAAQGQGEEQLGDRQWRWTRAVSATDDADILRIDIAVYAAGSDRIAAETVLFRNAR